MLSGYTPNVGWSFRFGYFLCLLGCLLTDLFGLVWPYIPSWPWHLLHTTDRWLSDRSGGVGQTFFHICMPSVWFGESSLADCFILKHRRLRWFQSSTLHYQRPFRAIPFVNHFGLSGALAQCPTKKSAHAPIWRRSFAVNMWSKLLIVSRSPRRS